MSAKTRRGLRPYKIAEQRARRSDQPRLFVRGYELGMQAARAGEDLDACDRLMTSDEMRAGLIEGAAAHRAWTATPDDYVPGSAAFIRATRSA